MLAFFSIGARIFFNWCQTPFAFLLQDFRGVQGSHPGTTAWGDGHAKHTKPLFLSHFPLDLKCSHFFQLVPAFFSIGARHLLRDFSAPPRSEDAAFLFFSSRWGI
jgi:hypothetical protein